MRRGRYNSSRSRRGGRRYGGTRRKSKSYSRSPRRGGWRL